MGTQVEPQLDSKKEKGSIIPLILGGLLILAIIIGIGYMYSLQCNDDEEKVGDKCLVKCTDGKTRVGVVCKLVCKDGEELVGDKCLVKCTDGQTRVAGICTIPVQTPGGSGGSGGSGANTGSSDGCLLGQELYKGICVLKCSSNFVRNPVNGLCQSPQMVGTDTVLCAAGQELVGTTCVVKCSDGYTRVGTVCQTNTVAESGNKCTTGMVDIDGICMYKQYVIHTGNEEAKDVLKKVVDLDTIKYAGDIVRVDFEVSHKGQGWGNVCSRMGLAIMPTTGGKYVYNVRMADQTGSYITKTGTTIFDPPLQVVPGNKISAALESEGKNCAVYIKDIKMTIYIKPK